MPFFKSSQPTEQQQPKATQMVMQPTTDAAYPPQTVDGRPSRLRGGGTCVRDCCAACLCCCALEEICCCELEEVCC
ncbi:hypothetical protein BOTBODRAFT_36019 [Botryobasidium botryosum FD-172 SS1]|uniref:Cysteine-rich transmembrane CYSTM domain-containing protein n=1 Tax=Botryobasidium botryosum (strain FD-172 SS1) TaxID=930990 RepID=A0A067MFN5_BOTB1|nr:hypothetical protein BOTBODRAFT_36019 [Botryobasidium botryosum FD-172 SS1]